MPRQIDFKAQLLKNNQGSFVSEDGRSVDYHNGTFFDIEEQRLFKANIKPGAPLPPIAKPMSMHFGLILGEKFTKLEFLGFE